MSLRRPLLIAVAVLAVATTPAVAQDPGTEPAPEPTATPTPPPAPTIAPGVFAGGVDLSGQTIEQATQLLAPLEEELERHIVVSVAGKQFTLKPRGARLAFDPAASARRAYRKGERNPPADGARLDVKLVTAFERPVLRRFVRRANRALYVAPRNARVKIGLRRIHRRKAKAGRDLADRKLRRTLAATLVDPTAERRLTPGRKKVRPRVRMRDLRRRYRTVVTVDKSAFRLRLFKRFRLVKSYGVAVGMPAYPTPSGLFRITNKAVNPTWTAPNSPWAGEMAGQQVAGGAPNNPLKARWMGIVNGVGIHGTGQEYSIGSRASHGCIRMRVADVIRLYRRVPVGTPVRIG